MLFFSLFGRFQCLIGNYLFCKFIPMCCKSVAAVFLQIAEMPENPWEQRVFGPLVSH